MNEQSEHIIRVVLQAIPVIGGMFKKAPAAIEKAQVAAGWPDSKDIVIVCLCIAIIILALRKPVLFLAV